MKLVTPQQAQKVLAKVDPMHAYLKRLHRRMLDGGYSFDHPLVQRVAAAMEQTYALRGELQYLAKHRRTH